MYTTWSSNDVLFSDNVYGILRFRDIPQKPSDLAARSEQFIQQRKIRVKTVLYKHCKLWYNKENVNAFIIFISISLAHIIISYGGRFYVGYRSFYTVGV